MRGQQLFSLSLLSSLPWVAADPDILRPKWKKAVCNADNCYRAVRASSAKPYPSSASADCMSFMTQTVTPYPVTTTTVTTVTVTAAPTSATITTIMDQTLSSTTVESIISPVTTIFDTVTFIQPTEVDVTNTIFTTITQTAVAAKRAVSADALPDVPAMVQPRVAACTASTYSPTRVPAYASACSGVVRYSSACSCAGITGGATTLQPVTSTATSTVTSTYTPTATVTTTLTNSVTVTVIQTQIIPTTIETTDSTVIVQSPFTIATSVVVPTTVIVSPPVCTTYNFVATNGFRSGQFVMGVLPATTPGQYPFGYVSFTGDATQAVDYTIGSDGSVQASANGETYGWVTAGNSLYYVLEMTAASQSFYGIRSVYCSVNPGTSSYPGAIGTLSCTSPQTTAIIPEYCVETGNNLMQNPGSPFTGCTLANLAVVPAC